MRGQSVCIDTLGVPLPLKVMEETSLWIGMGRRDTNWTG